MLESDLLKHIYTRSQELAAFPHVLTGPGDDCAVIRAPGGQPLLLTVDHLAEGRHFPWIDPRRAPASGPALTPPDLDLIARKAIARSISDIAAMGGSPLASLATACLPPRFPQPLADQLFDRMHFWAAHWSAPLVGGDISSSPDLPGGEPAPIVLTTTVLGIPHHRRGAVLRSTARPGDAVFVTGALGNSLASGRHSAFEPRLREAAWLCSSPDASPSAMIDLSDGLGRDAARIGRASGVRLTIDAATIPCHADCADWRRACADGEDYELLFTAAPGADVAGLTRSLGTMVTRIGRVEAGQPGCVICTPDGASIDAADMGWDHGSS